MKTMISISGRSIFLSDNFAFEEKQRNLKANEKVSAGGKEDRSVRRDDRQVSEGKETGITTMSFIV